MMIGVASQELAAIADSAGEESSEGVESAAMHLRPPRHGLSRRPDAAVLSSPRAGATNAGVRGGGARGAEVCRVGTPMQWGAAAPRHGCAPSAGNT